MLYKNVAGAIITDEYKRILLCQRAKEDSYGGYWEFPGGTIDEGETPEEALLREIDEELALKVKLREILTATSYQLSEDVVVNIIFYFCEILSGDLTLNVHDDCRWVYPDEFQNFQMPPADDTVASKLIERYNPLKQDYLT